MITRRPGTPRIIVDTGTWKTLSEVPLRLPLSKVTLGDEHFLTPTEDGPEFLVDEKKRVRFVGTGLIADLQFLDLTFVAVTQYGRSDVSVFDLDGNLKYVIKTDSPNQPSLLVAAAGGRFGIVVAGQTVAGVVANLLGLINGRMGRSLRVNVFETATGKQVADFESNPLGANRFALSPNGRLLASERNGQLRVVAIP